MVKPSTDNLVVVLVLKWNPCVRLIQTDGLHTEI